MRSIPDPGFAGDDGEADPAVAEALAAARRPGASRQATLHVLQDARLLVPVVAVLGEVEVDEAGLARDKSADMATVLMTRPDGRRGLLAFSSLSTLTAWDPQARPVPVTTRTAAQAALQDGADALVVDVAGPASYAVEGDALRHLAEGLVLTRVTGAAGQGWAWVRGM